MKLVSCINTGFDWEDDSVNGDSIELVYGYNVLLLVMNGGVSVKRE